MRTRWVAGLALLLSGGCAAVRQPAPVDLALPLPSASTLTAALEQQRTARTSLRSLARFTYQGPDNRGGARQALLVARPDRLRIEVFSPLGSIFVLAVADSALAAFVRNEATLYRGRASRANLQRYGRVDLEVTDAVDLLLGVPPRRSARSSVVSVDSESKTIRLWREINDGRHVGSQVVWFDRELRVVATEDRDAEGRPILRARFGRFAREHFDLPTRIAIELPLEQRRVELHLWDVELNPTLAPELFTLATPPGITEIRLNDGPGEGA